MKYIGTAKEFIENGLWLRFCEITGIDLWSVAKGSISEDELLEFEDLKEDE